MLEIGTNAHPTPHSDARYILLAKQKVLTLKQQFIFNLADFHPTSEMRSVFVGQFEGQDLFVCYFPHPPKGFEEIGLRDMLFKTVF